MVGDEGRQADPRDLLPPGPGEAEGPWAAVGGLPSTGRRVNGEGRGRGRERERGEKRGPEHEGARIGSRDPRRKEHA